MANDGTPKYDLLVIGGGPAGMSGARFARRSDKTMSIGMIRAQEHSITPCSMPYALSGTIRVEDFCKSDQKMLAAVGIDLVVDEATAIDTAAHRVVTGKSGDFEYGNLLIATGAEAIVPPLPGVDLPGVFTLRNYGDVIAIREAMATARQAVVVGGGYIGLEVAMAFHEVGIETHVIEMLPFCLGNVCSERIARKALDELTTGGIAVHAGEMAQAVVGDDHVTGVRIDGQTIPADIVILAIGVRGQTSLARDAGIEIGDFGIRVNDRMATSADGVWAAGDCVQHRSFVTGEPGVGQLATTAVIQAKTAAVNMTGGDRLFPGYVMASVTRLFENSYGATGLNRDHAAKAGIQFIEGESEGSTVYQGYPDGGIIHYSLLFDATTRVLIGAECTGDEEVAARIDMLTVAVMQRMTMDQIARLQYPAHPLHTDIPGHPPIVTAAEDAMRKAGLL